MERKNSPELLHIHGQRHDLLDLPTVVSFLGHGSTYGGLPSFSVLDTFDNRCIELASVRIRTAGQEKKNDEKTRSNLGYVLAPSKKGHPKNMVHFPDKTCHTRECIKGPAYQRFLSIWYERSELRMVPFSKTVGYVWKSFVRAQVSKQLAEPHEFSPHGPLSFMLTGSFLPCFSVPLFMLFTEFWGKFFLCSQ